MLVMQAVQVGQSTSMLQMKPQLRRVYGLESWQNGLNTFNFIIINVDCFKIR